MADSYYQEHFTVLSQKRGRIWGILNVVYHGGREVPRLLNGDRAYKATVRFEDDGREEELYMLQGCGNDLRYGGISRYLPGPKFRFEADPDVPATPTPAATPEPEAVPAQQSSTASAPEAAPKQEAPAPQPQPVTPAADPDGAVTLEFKRSNDDQPNMVRLKGVNPEDFTCSIASDGITLRYRKIAEEPNDKK
jgi:hypothetical protein